MTNKLIPKIPKINYSGVDPGYYEHKLNEVKSNKDLMMREYSKGETFAKEFLSEMKKKGNDNSALMAEMKMGLKPKNIAIGGGGGSEDFIDLKPSPKPSHHPSRSTEHNKRLLTVWI